MADLTLTRPTRPRALISLVPMIDVMLILLVFFMVTSTYLNLDMIPAVQRGDSLPPDSLPSDTLPPDTPAPDQTTGQTANVLIRLSADGTPVLQGRPLSASALQRDLAARVAATPQMQVLILPSAVAQTQALITVMEAATQAGVTRLRVVRLEARP